MFLDEYLPPRLRAYNFVSIPRWSTVMTEVDNGAEKRDQRWKNPKYMFTAPEAVTCQEQLEDIKDVWMATRGPLHTFPFRDPMDFASRRLAMGNVAPTTGMTDQVLGVGDGFTRDFQMHKAYQFGGEVYERLVYLPVVSSISVAINAKVPTDVTLGGGPYTFEVIRRGGIIRFTPAPREDFVLTWGGLFDVEARFENDDAFSSIVRAYGVAGFSDLSFVEIRPC